MFVGEWLNGRVAVSKTVGCVFESRLPCHKEKRGCSASFFFVAGETRFGKVCN